MSSKKNIGDLEIAAGQKNKERDYWLQKFSGEWIKSTFPYETGNAGEQNYRPGRYTFSLPGDISRQLIDISNGSEARLFMILMAGLVVLLHKYTGNRDIIIGAPIFKQVSEGDFINTVLPVRNPLPGSMTFKELIIKVTHTFLEATENQNYPLETLLYHLGLPTDGREFPLFDVAVLLENIHNRYYLQHLDLKMLFSFRKNLQSLEGLVEYNAQFYNQETVARIVGHFTHIYRQGLTDLTMRLTQIQLLSEREQREILVRFNDTGTHYPSDMTIPQVFARQVERTPGHIAVTGTIIPAVGHDGALDSRSPLAAITYNEIDLESGRLAQMLLEKGVEPDTIVAIMVERSIEIITGIMGILKAGGAYLPIDPDYPPERIDYMLADSGARILLAAPGTRLKVKAGVKKETLDIIDISHLVSNRATAPLSSFPIITTTSTWQANPGNLAYIIYTSGSTGRPKGVMIRHTAVVSLAFCQIRRFMMDSRDRVLQFSSICFDASVEQIFIALFSGAVLVLIDKTILPDPGGFRKYISRHMVTHIHAVPSFLEQVDIKDTARFGLAVKRVVSGGDTCSLQVAAKWTRWEAKPVFYNKYGPTETTVSSIETPILTIDPSWARLPIGKPMDNTQVYILDNELNPVPIGVKGELFIGGHGVARGYLNNPELTSEKFCLRRPWGLFSRKLPPWTPRKSLLLEHTPFTIHHSPLYRTGDLVRWQADPAEQGAYIIEFLGRIDDQVKIRGYRIETGEIENRLLMHPDIQEAFVLPGGEREENRHLCAYFVSGQKLAPAELRSFLSVGLPAYMIPAYFIQLKRIPLTPNGKVDRKALPNAALVEDIDYTAPRDEMERTLSEIMADVLNIEKDNIGIDANFFEMGGHSLNATIMVGKVFEKFEVEVPLYTFFAAPTIGDLSGHIRNARRKQYSPLEPIEKKQFYPLSSAQKRMFFLQQLQPATILYNGPVVLLLEGEPHEEKMEAVLLELIDRHESLRTSFIYTNDEPVQRIHDEVNFEIEFFEIGNRQKAIGNREKEENGSDAGRLPIACGLLPESIIKHFLRPFDLSQAPLMRVGLVKIAEEKHLLMIDVHHIISDGLSLKIFINESMALYSGEELKPLRLQYKDYGAWQQAEKQKEHLKKQEEYWLKEFSGEIPGLNLSPLGMPLEVPGFEFAGLSRHFVIAMEECKALKALALKQGATLYMVLLAVFYILLAKISGAEDIVIGTGIAGRRHPDLENIMGMFVNTLPLRNYPQGKKNFLEFLTEIKERTLNAFDNQDYQFEDLVREIGLHRTRENPLFNVMFALQNIDLPEIRLPGLTIKSYDYAQEIARMDLVLIGVEQEETLHFTLQYSIHLFTEEHIQRLTNYYKEIAAAVLENNYITIKDIKLSHPLVTVQATILEEYQGVFDL